MGFYIVGGVKINSTLIPYSSVDISPELEKALMNSDARSGHSFTGIKSAGPMVRVTSPALKSILDITGLTGAVLSAFELHLIKHDAAALASGSAHRKWTMTEAVASVESITTSGGHAEITIAIDAVEDGTNAVWALTDAVALPTSPRVTDVWFQGDVYVNTGSGNTLYYVEQSVYSPNLEKIKRISNGTVGPEFVGLKPAKPSVTLQSSDGILHGAIGAFGKNVTNVVLFYRKGSEGDGLRVADATETHISITIPSAFATPDGVSGTPGQEVSFGITLDLRDDGTNAVATLDTTAAIAAPA